MADRLRGARSFPGRSRSKRVSTWVGSADQGAIAVASNATVIMQSNATLGDTTVVRVRGLLVVEPNVYTADKAMQGAFGIGIVSDQAFAAGAASVPGPWTDPDWGGWFVWQAWAGRLEFVTGTGVRVRDSALEYQIDSKAMRKVESNETLIVVAESQVGAVNISTPFRMLLKLA